jgi:hypothetical protein
MVSKLDYNFNKKKKKKKKKFLFNIINCTESKYKVLSQVKKYILIGSILIQI